MPYRIPTSEVLRFKGLPEYRYMVSDQLECKKLCGDAQESIYRWWFEFLRCSRDYWFLCKISEGRRPQTRDPILARVYRDFGNIHSLPFSSWWDSRGEELFKERHQGTAEIREFESNSGGINYSNKRWGKIVLEIPLAKRRGEIIEEVKKILTEKGVGSKDAWLSASSAKYPLECAKFDLDRLKTIHTVYALKRYLIDRHNGDLNKPGQFELGAILELNPKAALQRGGIDSIRKKRNIMRVIVSRHLRSAKMIIENVETGRFPYSGAPEGAIPADRFTSSQRRYQKELESEWLSINPFSDLVSRDIREYFRRAKRSMNLSFLEDPFESRAGESYPFEEGL